VPAALRPQPRHDGAGELDPRDEVRLKLALDLLVGELLDRAALRIARVRDDDVDAAQQRERLVDDAPDRLDVADVELADDDVVAVALGELVEPPWGAQRRDDAIAALEQPLDERASEASRGPRDEPCRRQATGCYAARLRPAPALPFG